MDTFFTDTIIEYRVA